MGSWVEAVLVTAARWLLGLALLAVLGATAFLIPIALLVVFRLFGVAGIVAVLSAVAAALAAWVFAGDVAREHDRIEERTALEEASGGGVRHGQAEDACESA